MSLSPALLNILAIIADCYTPLLALIALVRIVNGWREGKRAHAALLVCSVFIVYMWMYIDEQLQLWVRFGLDYSTHTAAAFALVVLICKDNSATYPHLLSASLFGYGVLMYVLDYHSWGDMISTLLVIAACLLAIIYSLDRKPKLPQVG